MPASARKTPQKPSLPQALGSRLKRDAPSPKTESSSRATSVPKELASHFLSPRSEPVPSCRNLYQGSAATLSDTLGVRHTRGMAGPTLSQPSCMQARVWWPPTRNLERTGFSGMYWPVRVLTRDGSRTEVQYDNGERESVLAENVSPQDVPVAFGAEQEPLQVAEFVEVSNASESDPAAWVARIIKITDRGITVEYPFHDTPAEEHKAGLVRRARVWDEFRLQWNYVRPGQSWEDGDVTSPVELEQCHSLSEQLRSLQRLHKRSALTPSAMSETSERGSPRPKTSLPAATRSDPAAAPSGQAPDDEPQSKKQRPAT